tara:strand:+ start:3904 stop:4269 length:366 start_codon:yes stop_codon:yes gene_type:complete
MTDAHDSIEWPREIWVTERDDYDQGVVMAVLSEWATVARFEGDMERDREFHRYVDGDIFDSQAKYYAAERGRLRAENERLRALVRRAFNEGFGAGMDDFRLSRGGVTWEDSRSRKALEAKG